MTTEAAPRKSDRVGPRSPARPAAPSGGGRALRAVREPLLRLLTLVLLIVLWWLASRFWVGETWISSPALVWQRFLVTLKDGTLVTNTAVTFEEALLGLLIGTALGLVAGVLLHRARFLARILDPYILAAYSLPRIALAPFLVVWLGIGLTSKVFLVVSVVFFVVLLNVRQGLDTVDPDLSDALRSMKAGPWMVTRHLLIPTVLPWTVSAVKIAAGMALVSAVVGEIVGSTEGLGWYITNSLNQFDITGGIMALLVMAVLAMLLYYVLAIAEQRLFRWRSTSTARGTTPM